MLLIALVLVGTIITNFRKVISVSIGNNYLAYQVLNILTVCIYLLPTPTTITFITGQYGSGAIVQFTTSNGESATLIGNVACS
jgi:hypothetical protein